MESKCFEFEIGGLLLNVSQEILASTRLILLLRRYCTLVSTHEKLYYWRCNFEYLVW